MRRCRTMPAEDVRAGSPGRRSTSFRPGTKGIRIGSVWRRNPKEGPDRKGRDRKGCVSSETTRVDSTQEHRGEVRERDIISRSLRKRSRSPGLQILDEARRTAPFRPLILCGPRARTPPFGESPNSQSCVRFRRESAPSHESLGTGAPPWSCSLVLWS